LKLFISLYWIMISLFIQMALYRPNLGAQGICTT